MKWWQEVENVVKQANKCITVQNHLPNFDSRGTGEAAIGTSLIQKQGVAKLSGEGVRGEGETVSVDVYVKTAFSSWLSLLPLIPFTIGCCISSHTHTPQPPLTVAFLEKKDAFKAVLPPPNGTSAP